MKIFLDNVNLNSTSGPNSFAKRLITEIKKNDLYTFTSDRPDVQLSFITATKKIAPMALRLDGIYFNTRQDWKANNEPIEKSYNNADIVVYQSHFNKKLTENYFGEAKKSVVIGNGTCLDLISKQVPIESPVLDKYSEVWACSSSWRPHKRLKENVRYFLENAPPDACLVVAGENPDYYIKDDRILYVGHLSWDTCVSLYKRTKVFLHLAFLDHCPNVVVDARAAGCKIVVTSSGGTKEISGKDSVVIKDIEWDMSPLDLYTPPDLDFSKSIVNNYESSIDIKEIAKKYIKTLEDIL